MKFSSFTWKALVRRRPIDEHDAEQQHGSSNHHDALLQRRLTATDLIFYGVGCSVGAGIYSLVGIGAHTAGPAISLSFILAGTACCFTSLAYSEFASRIKTAGSAYTFVYVTFGELCGWLTGWNLTLGYAISAAVVARSWAEYVNVFLSGYFGANRFEWLTKLPISLLNGTCCPLSMVIIALCTLILVLGVKESARFNTIMTLLNLSVLCFTLLAGVSVVDSDNFFPVFPHGITGMAQGAGLVFFAYLGFDMVSCLSEEVVNPERNMPIGIIGSLTMSMSIYFAIAVVVVGMAPVSLLGRDVPIVNALLANACCSHSEQLLGDANQVCLSYSCHPVQHALLHVASRVISFGAIFGLTTATFTCLMGQPRIFYSMAKDGLLFPIYGQVNPETGVPTVGTLLTGLVTAIVACLIDLESLANAISLGTLMVFTFVDAGVILLRLEPSAVDSVMPLGPYPAPPVADEGAAEVARHLGLVDQTSQQIRSSLRRYSSRRGQRAAFVADDNHNTKAIWLLLVFTISAVVASATLSRENWPVWLAVLALFLLGCAAVSLLLLHQYPPPETTFACPFVPAVPLLGIASNAYMMGSMPSKTWSLICVWLVLGLVFYFGYGIHHSELRHHPHGEQNDAMGVDGTTTGLLVDAAKQDPHRNYRSI